MPKVVIPVEVDTASGKSKILDLAGGFDELGKKSKAGTTSMADGFKEVGKAIPGVGMAISAVTATYVAGTAAMAAATVALVARGSEVAGVSNAFQRLSAGVGQSSSEILRATREASQGMLSDFDIMANANKGLLLGLPITARDMATLSKTAISLGQAMDVGPGEAMSDLITGLGRGSAAILDNLGITVKAEDAYARYAAAIGKSVNDLTEAQKKTAIYQAATEAAGNAVAQVGGIQMTAAGATTQLQVAWQNAVDTLAMAIAKSPELIKLLQDIGAGAGGVVSAFADWTPGITANIDELIRKVRELFTLMQGFGMMAGPNGGVGGFLKSLAGAMGFAGVADSIEQAMKRGRGAVDAAREAESRRAVWEDVQGGRSSTATRNAGGVDPAAVARAERRADFFQQIAENEQIRRDKDAAKAAEEALAQAQSERLAIARDLQDLDAAVAADDAAAAAAGFAAEEAKRAAEADKLAESLDQAAEAKQRAAFREEDIQRATQYADGLLDVIGTLANFPDAFNRATDSASAFQRAMGGAGVGRQAGASIGRLFGPMGEAIGGAAGSIIGAVAGIFNTPSWVRVGKQAGLVLGVSISEEMARAIEARSKDLGISIQSSALLSLPDLLSSGALSGDSSRGQIGKLFSGILTGAVPAKQGVEALGKSFSVLAEQAEAAGGLASDAMLQILGTAAATGIRIAEVRQYVDAQVRAGATGIAAMFNFLGKSASATSEDFERVGRFALAAIDAMRAQGFTLMEIFDAVGEALDAAVQAAEDAGVEIPASLAEILAFRQLIKDNEDLVRSVEGTAAVLRMLFNTGMLTGKALDDVLKQAAADYDALIEAGFSNAQALVLTADTLRVLDRLYKEGKITLDEVTAARIEEARAAGLLDPTPEERMLAATEGLLVVVALLAETMGVTLPDAIKKAVAEWEKLNRVGAATPRAPGGPSGPGDGGGGEDTGEGGYGKGSPDLPGLAGGGYVPANPPYGTPYRIGEVEDEIVIPKSKVGSLGATVEAGAVQVSVNVGGGMGASDIPAIAEAVERGAAQALETALERRGFRKAA
jgi:hypothetical protein